MNTEVLDFVPIPRRVCLGLLVTGFALACVGCVERVIRITSQPSGALVYLNDEEVGRTPLTVPFTFYGTYDVRLEQDGYQPLWTQQEAAAPWWEAPGPDLFAEAVPNNQVQLDWHFQMTAQPPVDEQRLIERAGMARQWVTDAVGTSNTNPADAQP